MSRKSSVMEFLLENCKYSNYSLQLYLFYSLQLYVFKNLEDSWDNVCCGVPSYRSRREQVLYRIAALKELSGKILARPDRVLKKNSTQDASLKSMKSMQKFSEK